MNRLTSLLLDRVATWLCGRDLWEAALGMVSLYEHKEMPSAEKRERVLAALRKEFELLGKDLALSLIGFAMEAALQYVRRRHT